MASSDPNSVEGGSHPRSRGFNCDVWTVEDHLRYEVYAKALADFIQHAETRGPFVVAIQGPWGQGKTSFMRMVQKCLDPSHPDLSAGAPKPLPATAQLTRGELRKMLAGRLPSPIQKRVEFATVWFEAWNHQNSEHLWSGLAHCIISQLAARISPLEREKFWLSLQLDRVDPDRVRSAFHKAVFEKTFPAMVFSFGLVFLAMIVSALMGWDTGSALGRPNIIQLFCYFIAALGTVAPAVTWWLVRSNELSKKLEGTYVQLVRNPGYRDRMGSLPLVKEDVSCALARLVDPSKPAVVFIDDLDRCLPINVAEVISAINLFLAANDPHCIFVLGMDAEVVAAAMEVAHEKVIAKLPDRGGELGWSYMDKFVQLPVVLPRVLRRDQDSLLVALLSPKKTLSSPESRTVGPVEEEFEIPSLEELMPILDKYHLHLSFNPRTLLKVVNLLRLHLLLAKRRQKVAGQQAVEPEQILIWVILLARWPSFVRWIQRLQRVAFQQPQASLDGSLRDNDWEYDGAQEEAMRGALERVIERAQMTDGPEAWATELNAYEIGQEGWPLAPGLWEFLKQGHELRLDQASEHGLW